MNKILNEIENFSNPLKKCVCSALAGGLAISDYKSNIADTKGDAYVGHHAIVGDDDIISQRAILDKIFPLEEDEFFITEEHVQDVEFQKRIIKSSDLDKLPFIKFFCIDELDGSSSKKVGHYEWATSVGYIDKMEHIAGAVFAPKVENGTLYYTSKESGTNIIYMNGKKEESKIGDCSEISKSYVLFGPDFSLSKYPVHNRLFVKLGDACRTTNINGSCALALSLVASGKADALVQPIQSPWDYAAGLAMINGVGGKMLFYEMEKGDSGLYEKILPVDKPHPKHYNPEKRMLGFVASNDELAPKIMNILLDTAKEK